ncbi:hypothetical protein BC826DRAFT_922912 [Russula brevipes]|nr:hypothetical protein BC826DRAFT_922912 [Russula brevipes]
MEPECSKTPQWVGSPPPSSLGSLHIQGNIHRNILTDGYISYTFTPRIAEIYISYLLRVDLQTVGAFSFDDLPGAFFVWNRPANHGRPSRIVNERPAWLLDYAISREEDRAIRPVVAVGSVVLQELWSPRGQGDWRRYFEQAQLQLPIFFVNTDGSVGVPVTDATARQMSLQGADHPVPLGDRTSLKIRICWPGYEPSEHQIRLRDQTPAKNLVTFERFVKHVGSRVQHFLEECERIPLHQPNQNFKWIVGHDHITYGEVVLIGVVQVSAGSWTPILQLRSRVIM